MMLIRGVFYEEVEVFGQPDFIDPEAALARVPVTELAREYEISTALTYQWCSKYGGKDAV